MLDLNIDAGFPVDSASCGEETDEIAINTLDADSVTSTTNNAAFAAADELDSNSSTHRESISTLNFFILHENAIEIEDNMNNGVANNINELQLFPVSPLSSPPAVDRANHWLNSPVAKVSCGGGAELGIFKAQMLYNNQLEVQVQQPPVKKSRRGPRSRSSQYRGVTFYRRTGRWESHIWDCGKQVYLGGFDTAHAAARAYDRAAVKFRGVDADINFSISDYEEDMKQVKNLTKAEFVQILRRKSNGFSRGSSKFRGVTLHRMGPIFQEKAYHDKATIIYNQREMQTNFELSNFKRGSTFIDGGSGRNLDLNLGISSASDSPQRNYTTSNFHFPRTSSESPYGKGVKVQNSSASSQGLITTTRNDPTRGGIYSGFSPNSKETAMAMSAETISLPGISNWEGKMQSHVVVNPLLFSAASSGFSSTPHSNSLI